MTRRITTARVYGGAYGDGLRVCAHEIDSSPLETMMARAAQVCVAIPIYRVELSRAETVSLQRCVEMLGSHPIVLVKPQSLDIGSLQARHPQLGCEAFADEFFGDIAGYNRLMLSDEFYARFSQYEFILIHQLDAFVFSDQLHDWCSRSYDYVGAPWLPDRKIPGAGRRARVALRRKVYRLFDIQGSYTGYSYDPQLSYAVGNGGFSLRRIAPMRSVLASLCERAEAYRHCKRRVWAEDVFFSVEANRYWHHVKTPGFNEAVQFSWESAPAVAAQLNDGRLPFGCHAWSKLHRDVWRPIFARLGYSLDTLLGS